MIGLEMIVACAPNVAPETIQKIVYVESRGNSIAINANDRVVTDKEGKKIRVRFKAPMQVKTVQDAVTVAYAAIEAGHSVDLGYMQINSRNLPSLGYSVEDMLKDGCKNIAAGAKILTAFYSAALPKHSGQQEALRAALSAYNTGNFNSGFLNGYVARYSTASLVTSTPNLSVPAVDPYTSTTAVFSRSQHRKEVAMSETKEVASTVIPLVSKSQADAATPGVQVEYTADEAERNGAFVESAMTETDAWAANSDLAQDQEGTAILAAGKLIDRTAGGQ